MTQTGSVEQFKSQNRAAAPTVNAPAVLSSHSYRHYTLSIYENKPTPARNFLVSDNSGRGL